MDQFIVSARKYRPATFSTVVGQRHIAGTLKNAIRSNHLAQAFLFCGPRGVGKTTCARILAKTINCFNRTEQIEACEECDSCKSFNEGHSLNIYELDAASNNSVEDIRGLIEKVRFAPQIGTKKVYIIDEVHMLSTQAFNAFLKTLEEPPAHAIFILATTEKHKIIPTILSRCQVFDFNRIEVDDITHHLEEIAEKEQIKTEHDALHLIAGKSDGSLRDALSMFDQMVTYSGNDLTYQAVVENLSILSTDYFFNFVNHFVTGEVHPALLLYNEILRKGFDGHHFLLGLGEHLRNLLVAQDHSTIELLSVGKAQKEKYREQTLVVTSDYLVAALNLISKADVQYKSSRNQRLLVELLLINLSTLKPAKPGTEAQKKTEVVAKPAVVKSQPEPSIPIPESSKPAPDNAQTAVKPNTETVQAVTSEKTQSERDSPPSNDETVKTPVSEVAPSREEVARKNEERAKEMSRPAAPETKESQALQTEPTSTPKPPSQNQSTQPAAKSVQRSIGASIVTDSVSISDYTKAKPTETVKQHSDIVETGQPTEQGEPISEEGLKVSWDHLISHYEKENKLSLFATLKKYAPQLLDEHIIELTYDNKAQLQAINSEKTFILGLLRKELKNPGIQLKMVISKQEQQKAYTPAEKLEKLIEKNPNISLLKDRLDLDLG